MDQFRNHPLYRRHNIDSVMSSLWEFYTKKFLSLFLISLAMSLVMQYTATFINVKELQGVTDPMVMLGMLKDMIVPILIISLINLLFTTILQYYIIYSPVDHETGFFLLLVKSLKYYIPFLILMVLFAFASVFAIVLGFLALIVGVFFSILYIMALYLLILPVMMVEGANIGYTISRSFSLLHRNFWANIGWVAVLIIILIVVSLILSSIILLPFAGSFFRTILNPAEASKLVDMTTNPLYIVLSALAGSLTLPVLPIFACIMYFNGKAGEDEDKAKKIAPVNPENDRVRVEDLYAKPYSDDHPDNPQKKD